MGTPPTPDMGDQVTLENGSGLPVHPVTGLRAVGFCKRGPIWPIRGAAEGDDDQGGDGGHPDVSLEELKASLVELGLTPGQLKSRLAASRRWEDRAKEKDPEFQSIKSERDALKAKESQFDALLATTQTDQERAVTAAREEAKAAAQLEAAPRLVRAEFKAAAKGVLDDTQLAALLEDRDLTKYVTATGDVDEAKVAKIIADAAPKGQQKHVPLGQGNQRTDVKPSVAAGRDLYEASRKKNRTTG